jgi:hypothetical protein
VGRAIRPGVRCTGLGQRGPPGERQSAWRVADALDNRQGQDLQWWSPYCSWKASGASLSLSRGRARGEDVAHFLEGGYAK